MQPPSVSRSVNRTSTTFRYEKNWKGTAENRQTFAERIWRTDGPDGFTGKVQEVTPWKNPLVIRVDEQDHPRRAIDGV